VTCRRGEVGGKAQTEGRHIRKEGTYGRKARTDRSGAMPGDKTETGVNREGGNEYSEDRGAGEKGRRAVENADR
jgi:hypothetical protein